MLQYLKWVRDNIRVEHVFYFAFISGIFVNGFLNDRQDSQINRLIQQQTQQMASINSLEHRLLMIETTLRP